MNNTSLTKYLLAVVILLLLSWVFWPKQKVAVDAPQALNAKQVVQGNLNDLESAIKPITKLDMVPVEGVSGISEEIQATIQQQFQLALNEIKAKNWNKAGQILQKMVDDNPTLIEPYINLSVVRAKTKNLEDAQQILVDGLTANEGYNKLFENLQKVHGAIAANAYRKALNETESIEALDLSLVEKVNFSPVIKNQAEQLSADYEQLKLYFDELTKSHEVELNDIKQQLAARNAQLKHSSQLIKQEQSNLQKMTLRTEKQVERQTQQAAEEKASYLAKIKELEETLEKTSQTAKDDLAAAEAQYQTQLEEVRQTEAQKRADAVAAKENEAQKTIARIEQSTQTKLQQMQQALKAAELKAQQVATATVDKKVEPTMSVAAVQESEEKDNKNTKQQVQLINTQKGIAEKLVKQWARAWSEQNVAAYIGHYTSDYEPVNKQLTNQQWREQRKQRLTNKSFIEVSVRDFEVNDGGERFSVSFVQQYRSNTMDDTIRKRLVFAKNGNDWNQAKIVEEVVLR